MSVCIKCIYLYKDLKGCKAYPAGRPFRIKSSQIPHDSVQEGQVGNFVFKEVSKKQKFKKFDKFFALKEEI